MKQRICSHAYMRSHRNDEVKARNPGGSPGPLSGQHPQAAALWEAGGRGQRLPFAVYHFCLLRPLKYELVESVFKVLSLELT